MVEYVYLLDIFLSRTPSPLCQQLKSKRSSKRLSTIHSSYFVLSVPFIMLLNTFPITEGCETCQQAVNLSVFEESSQSSKKGLALHTSVLWSWNPSLKLLLPSPCSWSCPWGSCSWLPSFEACPGVWCFEAPARLYAASIFFTPVVLKESKSPKKDVWSVGVVFEVDIVKQKKEVESSFALVELFSVLKIRGWSRFGSLQAYIWV